MITKGKKQTAGIASSSLWKSIKGNAGLYVFLIPALVYLFIFLYGPMYGILIAFKNYNMAKGVWGSDWVGIYNFKRFFKGYNFWSTLWNTVSLSLYFLLATLPLPVILGLMFNNIRNGLFKKGVQMVTYAPNFISLVIIVGMLKIFTVPETGLINVISKIFGGRSDYDLFGNPAAFRHLYVWSGVWQTLGWNSIIYVAALAGISPDLYEAAKIDGATRLQRIWHLEIPGILPTVTTMLILNVGSIMNLGFEKVYLMQTPLNLKVAETIPTYVYKMGIINGDYGLATAIGLFNSVVSCILMLIVNYACKKLSDTSLF